MKESEVAKDVASPESNNHEGVPWKELKIIGKTHRSTVVHGREVLKIV